MFLNVSNHPSDKWQPKQVKAALVYGEIIDCPFPRLDARYTKEDISRIAGELCAKIIDMKPAACLVSGEFTLTFQLVEGLMAAGITVLAACTERNTVEKVNGDGTITKIAAFDFVQFREYGHFNESDQISESAKTALSE